MLDKSAHRINPRDSGVAEREEKPGAQHRERDITGRLW
jgi:hypothetical protein